MIHFDTSFEDKKKKQIEKHKGSLKMSLGNSHELYEIARKLAKNFQ